VSRAFEIIVPIVTPYDARGGIDARALAAHAALLAEGGVDGFFVCGTNGEGPLLTDEEVVQATRAVAGAAGGLRVIPQAGRPSTDASCRLTERVIEAGADAVAIVTPYFFTLTPETAIEHYRRVLEVSGEVPLYAYAIPAYARNDLTPEVAAALADDGLAGVKDSTKSLDRHRAYIEIRATTPGGRFDTFVGEDALTLAALELGSSGAVPALANVRPGLFVELLEAAGRGDAEHAAALQEEIVRVRTALRGEGIASLKHAVSELMGRRGVAYGAAVRGPLPPHRTARED
jgi:4-hydroxy-tetrahydrodipicolinate synthase